ncbi:MAG TPA: MBL fold metallo-hydrolase [Woeseiaceae bacterium]|nr:MBL fold metallo-hydrolase [Woeseiaceae bacterium]
MKRLFVTLAVAAGVLLAAAYVFRTELATRAMRGVVASNLQTDLARELPDGLHVALCGAGSPLPDPLRSGPCTAVMAGERLYIVDVGGGASRTLSRLRIPQGAIDAILLTHFHSDHIDGLGELLMQRWANGTAVAPTPVIGPAGVEEVVRGFGLAYAADDGYRIAHHGAAVMPPAGAGGIARPFPPPRAGAPVVVLDDGGLRITAFRVEHAPVEPAVGYRFDYAGRSVVISGDTSPSDEVRRQAAGVDLLVHEALAPHLVALLTEGAREAGRDNLVTITEDILEYHTTPVEAARIAAEAEVGFLLYNHIVPPLPLAPLEDAFTEGVDAVYAGPFRVGRDGTLVSLPAGSETIEVDELL